MMADPNLVFLRISTYSKVFLMGSAVLATRFLQVKDGTMLLMKA
jgi:hypothetical protein